MAHAEVTNKLGLLPMEVLQSAFWAMDPDRTIAKYAALAELSDDDPRLVAFARLEDWANDGAPLTAAAGRDLFEGLFIGDWTGRRNWKVAGKPIDAASLPCPAHQFSAANDRIAPADTACRYISVTPCPSGHVGMMVGSRAREGCWEPVLAWIMSGHSD
jgi:polyhydroxyalkanoate synthase